MATQTQTKKRVESAEGLDPACNAALRNLLVALADTKLLLGYHYGEWTFGTPALEAAIACCSLGQGELGHVRLLHGILNAQYGETPEELVEGRQPEAFANVAYLDRPLKDWSEFVGANYIVDLAMTTLLLYFKDSTFQPLHTSVEKMIQEEKYHVHHGQGWFRTVARKSDAAREALAASTAKALHSVVVWFGPPDAEDDRDLVQAGIKTATSVEVLNRFLNEVGALAKSLNVDLGLKKQNGSWQLRTIPNWQAWDPVTRRLEKSGPDEEILYRLRGSKNAVFKLS